MPKNNDSYTILILPDPTAKPYTFSIRKKTLHCLLGVLSITVLVFSGFFAQSLTLLGHLTELNLLRNETKGHRVQVQSALEKVDSLKKEIARLGELDEKLRIMTDLPSRKKTVNPLAQGGREEPMAASSSEGTLLSNPSKQKPFSTAQMEIPRLTAHIEKEVKFLSIQAKEEEKSFKELIKTISEMKSRWASTPSIWPVKEGWVTSGFGKRVSPFTGTLVMHNGLDIAAERGTPIIASAFGVVTRLETDLDLGRMVALDHGNGKVTWYGHMEKQIVKKGQKVSRGEVIGLIGSTGHSTGPHLHYEVRIDNTPVNPTKYILN